MLLIDRAIEKILYQEDTVDDILRTVVAVVNTASKQGYNNTETAIIIITTEQLRTYYMYIHIHNST